MQTSSENGYHRHVITAQVWAQIFTEKAASNFCSDVRSVFVARRGSSRSDALQGYQGEVNPQVEHEIPGEEEGTQMMQLSQVQLAQIVSSAVSQALTQQMQQIVQQVQSPTKFETPAFERDSAASWLTWIQRVVYQARACGFEAKLPSVEGGGLSVGGEVSDGSKVDPVILRNAHVAWTTTAEERHLKLCNVAKHRMTSGETSNHTPERK